MKFWFILAAALLVSACTGGGGGSGGRSTGFTAICVQTQLFGCLGEQAFDSRVAALQNTYKALDAFKNSWGLATIGADRAWAQIELVRGGNTMAGSGITVGVIDSGIDTSHFWFNQTQVSEEFHSGGTDEDGSVTSHGTAVASVIAGRPPSDEVTSLFAAYGVAPAAGIAMFAVSLSGLDRTSHPYRYVPSSLSREIGAGLKSPMDAAMEWSSNGRTIDFVNLSLGFTGLIEQYNETTLRTGLATVISTMAQAGKSDKTVFVWAAGNAHGDPCNATDFAGLLKPELCANGQVNATSPEVMAGLPAKIAELRGHVIAVAALGTNGTIASFSNRCGIAADWCLTAPGEKVRTAFFGPILDDDGNPVVARGTSEASGTSFAAPMVTGALAAMKQLFRSQLSNAELVARMMATANRRGIYANASIYGRGVLDLGAATSPVGLVGVAFGSRVDGPGAPLGQTRLTLGRAFGDGLQQAFAGQEVAGFDALGAPFWYGLDGFAHAAAPPAAAARLDAFMAPDRAAGGAGPLLGGFAPAGPAFAPETGLRIGLANGVEIGPERLQFGLVGAPAEGGGHLALAAGALAVNAAGRGGLSLTALSSEGMADRPPVSGALLSWQPPGASVGLRGGWLAERETLLGSRAGGAFGRLASGSAFVGLDGNTWLGAWRLDASAELGLAQAGSGGGLLTRLSPVYSSAFALRAQRPLGEGTSLRLTVSQPLRVERGRAGFSVPVGRTPDGEVLRRSIAAGLTPTGRQIDIAVRWQRRLTRGGELRLGAAWTRHPGHNAAAPADLTLLAGWRHRF